MTVKSAGFVTPGVRRIRFCGPAVRRLGSMRPAAWVKLFLDDDGQPSEVGRAYTIRHFSPMSGEMDIDFVLHGHGPLSSWAEQANEGDVIHGVGPRDGYEPPVSADHHVFIGDASAVPAMFGVIEQLPSGRQVEAFVEIPDESFRQIVETAAEVELRWLVASPGSVPGKQLIAVCADVNMTATTSVWIAAESGAVQCMRRELACRFGLKPPSLSASGYWKSGDRDFRDPNANWN